MEYYCTKCGEVCILRCGNVICRNCGYEVPKDTADKANLLKACKRSKTYLATLPGKYGIECRHLFTELKAIIAKCEKGSGL